MRFPYIFTFYSCAWISLYSNFFALGNGVVDVTVGGAQRTIEFGVWRDEPRVVGQRVAAFAGFGQIPKRVHGVPGGCADA